MGARFFLVSSVLNQMSIPIARVRAAAAMMPKAWSLRYVRLRRRKKAGRLRRKVRNMMKELIIEAGAVIYQYVYSKIGHIVGDRLPVSGQWSSKRFEAMFSTLVLFLIFMRVYSGMKRCKPAQSRKMMSKTINTMRILFAMAALCCAGHRPG